MLIPRESVLSGLHTLRVRKDDELVPRAAAAADYDDDDGVDARLKRSAQSGFAWPSMGTGRDLRTDALSHALRIKKNSGSVQ